MDAAGVNTFLEDFAMFRFYLAVITLLSSCITGCAYSDFKHLAYDSLQSRQCLKDTGTLACDTDRIDYRGTKLDYPEYKRERDKLVKKDQ